MCVLDSVSEVNVETVARVCLHFRLIVAYKYLYFLVCILQDMFTNLKLYRLLYCYLLTINIKIWDKLFLTDLQ